jgi:hypothetical protein
VVTVFETMLQPMVILDAEINIHQSFILLISMLRFPSFPRLNSSAHEIMRRSAGAG